MAISSFTQIAAGVVCLVVALAPRPFVDHQLWLFRMVGQPGLAHAWEGRLSWWIPTVRVVCVVLAAVLLAMGSGPLPSR